MPCVTLSNTDSLYPDFLRLRLGSAAPERLTIFGSLDLLAVTKTALFCSARCPGNVILPTYDQAARWREEGRCVISGFHSPVEKECLAILLRGKQPIIVCPARNMPRRIPKEWQSAIEAGRLLILSGFASGAKRVTSALAAIRNNYVAALAERVCFAHITPGGQTEKIFHRIVDWDVPWCRLDKHHSTAFMQNT